MVVLCLRFRTGTQILIYFPVLLQISSATSGQLLWEKHVKAPKWLMNPSPFTKRGIAADSQREKHMGMLTIAKAIPQVTVSVLPHHLPEHQEASVPRGEWLPSEWSWKMSRRWHRREGSAALWPPVDTLGAESLGICSLSWFPSSAQFSLVDHIWERLRCDVWICAGRRCQDWHGQLVYPEGSRDSWLFSSCLGQKRKNQEQPSVSRADGVGVGKFSLGSLPTHSSQTHHWNLLPKNPREEIRKKSSLRSCAPSLWSRTVTKTQYSPFLLLTLGLPYQD